MLSVVRQHWTSVVVVILSVLAGAWVTSARLAVEKSNQVVGLMIDYYANEQLAEEADWPLSDLLRSYKGVGVWGVGLEEVTVAQAARAGQLILLDGCEAGPTLQAMGLGVLPIRSSSVYVVWWPATTPQWLDRALRLHLQPWARSVRSSTNLEVWEIEAAPPVTSSVDGPVRAAAVGSLGLGLSEHAVRTIRQAGLQVVPRFLHAPSVTVDQVRARLGQISSPLYDQAPVIFMGQRIPGYPELGAQWIQGLRELRLPVGLIELATQPGAASVATGLDFNAMRVHAISAAEMQKLAPEVAVERWRRAARERDIRILYVRPLMWDNPHVVDDVAAAAFDPVQGHALIERNLEYVEQIATGLKKDGFTTGAPSAFSQITYPWPLLVMLAAGVAAAGWLLLTCLFKVPSWPGPVVAVLGGVLFAVTYVAGRGVLGRQLFALAAAVIFPTLGVLLAQEVVQQRHGVIKGFWLATAVTLLGALQLVGLLADVRFMLKVDQFMGVKLAHIAPLALLTLAVILGPLPLVWERGARGWGRVRRVLDYSLPVRYLLLAGLVGLAGLVYLMRTGNDALPVFALEQRFRQLLETLLVVRPRTKEFLIGHPLLVVALDQHARGRRSLAGWLMVGGVIGQLSIANTFSHIHTALWVSVWRTGLGLVLGLAFGWFVLRPLVGLLARRGRTDSRCERVGDGV